MFWVIIIGLGLLDQVPALVCWRIWPLHIQDAQACMYASIHDAAVLVGSTQNKQVKDSREHRRARSKTAHHKRLASILHYKHAGTKDFWDLLATRGSDCCLC